MDEEYDVIVLGTGLTVSSQPPFPLRRNDISVDCVSLQMSISATL